MGQITIYINNELEKRIKELASSQNTSLSKYISTVLEKNISNKWDPKVKDLAGSWGDFPTAQEIRESSATDIKREEF